MLNSDLFGLSQELKIKKKKTPLSSIRQKKNKSIYKQKSPSKYKLSECKYTVSSKSIWTLKTHLKKNLNVIDLDKNISNEVASANK